MCLDPGTEGHLGLILYSRAFNLYSIGCDLILNIIFLVLSNVIECDLGCTMTCKIIFRGRKRHRVKSFFNVLDHYCRPTYNIFVKFLNLKTCIYTVVLKIDYHYGELYDRKMGIFWRFELGTISILVWDEMEL